MSGLIMLFGISVLSPVILVLLTLSVGRGWPFHAEAAERETEGLLRSVVFQVVRELLTGPDS